MSFNYSFTFVLSEDSLTPEFYEMFGMKPKKREVSVRKMTEEESQEYRFMKFDQYEEVL